MYASTGDARFKSRADTVVTELAKVQAAEATKFHPGYLSAFPEELFDRVDARQRVWAPYYTIHKIMAGLLDAYVLTANAQALEVLTKQADWVAFRVGRLTDEQQQRALDTEFGGMNEVLANLFAVTGDAVSATRARRFEHRRILDPARAGNRSARQRARQHPDSQDHRRGARIRADRRPPLSRHRAVLLGSRRPPPVVRHRRQQRRRIVLPGTGDLASPRCRRPGDLQHLQHAEADAPCLRVGADAPRRWTSTNGRWSTTSCRRRIRRPGMVSYYCPLKPGGFKTFSTPTDSFWCCVGTGMENHAKYNDSIYFHDEASLYVNLFIPSEVTWTAKQAKIRQLTKLSGDRHDVADAERWIAGALRGAAASSRLGPIGDDHSRERPAGGLVVESWQLCCRRSGMETGRHDHGEDADGAPPGVAAGRSAHPGAHVRAGRARRRPGNRGAR